MATKKRTYNDLCGLSHALELVGERWAILILRELSYGPKRFTDIRSGLPAASPNVLSQRLRELEAHGIVSRRTLAPPAASKVYELTEWGASWCRHSGRSAVGLRVRPTSRTRGTSARARLQ